MATELEKLQARLDAIETDTVKAIEDGLADLRKGLASKDEVTKLIDERKSEDGQKLTTLTEQLETLKSQMTEADETKETVTQMQNQLKRMRQSGLTGSGNSYRGRLGSVEEARMLGLLMMAATLPSMAGKIPGADLKYARVLKAIKNAGVEMIPIESESGRRIEKSGAAEGSAASGSLLVTSEMAPGFIMLLETYGLARRLFQRVPMGAASTFTPKMDSLPTYYVPGEGTAPTVTDPTIKGVNLVPKTLTALGYFSMELDEDSAVEMGELYANWFARGASYYEDLCALLGDGTSTYFGFRGITGALRAVSSTIASIKSLVVGTGNAYSELVYGDFEKVVGILPDYADANAQWIMHRYFYYTVFIRAALAAGTAGAHSEIILGTAQKQKQAAGYPVNFSPVMPKAEANSQICALFGDYSLGGQFGTRGAAEFATSDQRYFDQALIAIRHRERVAINAHGVGDTTNAGPLCGLITAAA